MLKKPRYIAIVIIIILGLVLLNLPERMALRIKLAIGAVFLPLFGLAHTTQNASDKIQQTILPRSALVAELEQARQEIATLKIHAVQTDEVWRENQRLRELLGQSPRLPWSRKLARVVGRDPANWWRAIHIDKGSAEGIRPNLAVITLEGLVGRVTETGLHRSQVVLVGDPNCRVAALIQETRDATGILIPSTSDIWDNNFADLTYLPRTAALSPGQKVITSGQGGVFPKGIPLGQIVDIRNVEYGLYQEARIKLAVNLNRLEEVWVILPP